VTNLTRHHVAFHEAGHAVAGYLLGEGIEGIDIIRSGDELEAIVEAEGAGGCVRFAARVVESLADAQTAILGLLAGEAAVRISWAMQVLTDEQVDPHRRAVRGDELPVEDLLAVPNGATPTQSAAYFGWLDDRGKSDMDEAEALARKFALSQFEAAAMMAWLQAWTSEWVQSERFQRLVGMLASVLLDRGSISGQLATELLDRADRVFALSEGGK
jgi:hypothetical protein